MDGVYCVSERSFSPWKNGGGETAQILTLPAEAGAESFDLRLSTAIVAADGPFSEFAGIDRVLTVIDGGPMVLSLDGQDHELTMDSPPFAFSGELPCSARLTGAELLDFNVMVRRPWQTKVKRGPLVPLTGNPDAAYALLLEPRAGLARLDLVDLLSADPRLVTQLAGAEVLLVLCVNSGS